MLDDPGALAGEEVDVTVMFVDIRGFTKATGGVAPREAVARLNEFFEVVVPVLHAHGGHANKFVGDGLLAGFGVPEYHADHADRALAAACDLHRHVAEAFDGELRIGIGVNSGRVLAGTVGGGGKLEFTLIGDAVNVASRVEELSKEMGDGILCTEATRLALKRDGADLRPRGEHCCAARTSRHRCTRSPEAARALVQREVVQESAQGRDRAADEEHLVGQLLVGLGQLLREGLAD